MDEANDGQKEDYNDDPPDIETVSGMYLYFMYK